MSMAVTHTSQEDQEMSTETEPILPKAAPQPVSPEEGATVEEDTWASYYDEEYYLNTDRHKGLSTQEAHERMKKFGRNEFSKKGESQLWKLIKSFFEPMAIVVWMAIIIEAVQTADKWPGSDANTDFVDVWVLLLLQFLNSFVGWYENMVAEQKIERLAELGKKKATVVRDGIVVHLPEEDLVPGDIIHLGLGCGIPADCRIVFDNDLSIKVDESMLTGESEAQTRRADDPAIATLSGTDESRCISQTVLLAGKAEAIVIRTGEQVRDGLAL